MKLPKTLVTRENVDRLQCLLDSWTGLRDRDRTPIEILAQKLDSVEVVPTDKIPHDVVTMNSQVCVRDLDASRVNIYTLVFPRSANVSKGKVSVPLSELPFWDTAPALRSTGKFRVAESGCESEKILYQPEAARKTELDAALVDRDSYGPAA